MTRKEANEIANGTWTKRQMQYLWTMRLWTERYGASKPQFHGEFFPITGAFIPLGYVNPNKECS